MWLHVNLHNAIHAHAAFSLISKTGACIRCVIEEISLNMVNLRDNKVRLVSSRDVLTSNEKSIPKRGALISRGSRQTCQLKRYVKERKAFSIGCERKSSVARWFCRNWFGKKGFASIARKKLCLISCWMFLNAVFRGALKKVSKQF